VTRSVESRSAYKFLFGNPERKRFEENIKLDLKGWDGMGWTGLI
jgi:hypothetical protein